MSKLTSQAKTKNRIVWGDQPAKLPQLNLIDVQKESYDWFLSLGIKESLESISPIADFTGKNWQLSFGEHQIGKPKHSHDEAQDKGLSYEVPLRVKAKLTNLQTGDEVEQEVF